MDYIRERMRAMNFIRKNGIVIEFVIRTFLLVDFATIILIFLGLCINQEAGVYMTLFYAMALGALLYAGIAKFLFNLIKHWEEA